MSRRLVITLGVFATIMTIAAGAAAGFLLAGPAPKRPKPLPQPAPVRAAGSLGVKVIGLSPNYACLRLPVASGLLVEAVDQGGAAAVAGLHGGHQLSACAAEDVTIGGDIITAINSQALTDPLQLYRLLSTTHDGQVVTVTYVRGRAAAVTKRVILRQSLDNPQIALLCASRNSDSSFLTALEALPALPGSVTQITQWYGLIQAEVDMETQLNQNQSAVLSAALSDLQSQETSVSLCAR